MTRRKEDIMRGGILRLLVIICFAIAALILFHPVKAEAATSKIDPVCQQPFSINWNHYEHAISLSFNRNGHNGKIVENVNGKAVVLIDLSVTDAKSPGKDLNHEGVHSQGFWIRAWKDRVWDGNGYKYDTTILFPKGAVVYPIELMSSDMSEIYAVYRLTDKNGIPTAFDVNNPMKDQAFIHLRGDINENITKDINIYLDKSTNQWKIHPWYGRHTELRKDGIWQQIYDGTWEHVWDAAREHYEVIDFGYKADNDQENVQWQGNTNTYSYFLAGGLPIASSENTCFYNNNVWYRYKENNYATVNFYSPEVEVESGDSDGKRKGEIAKGDTYSPKTLMQSYKVYYNSQSNGWGNNPSGLPNIGSAESHWNLSAYGYTIDNEYWYSEPDGKGTKISMSETHTYDHEYFSGLYDFAKNSGGTINLYAYAKINAYPITYKLQKDSDAEIDMPGTVSLANKKTVVYPAHGGLYFENPRLTNEKFTGWTCAELGNTEKTKNLTISSDQIKAWYQAKADKNDNVGITMVAHFEAVPPFEFVDSKTGQTPILNETEKNQGKFRIEEIESSPGYIYEDQYHDIDLRDSDDMHEYQDKDYRNVTFPSKNGK